MSWPNIAIYTDHTGAWARYEHPSGGWTVCAWVDEGTVIVDLYPQSGGSVSLQDNDTRQLFQRLGDIRKAVDGPALDRVAYVIDECRAALAAHAAGHEGEVTS